MADLELNQFDPDHLNQVAGLLTELYGFLPLDVRYQAAAAALDRVRAFYGEPEDPDEDPAAPPRTYAPARHLPGVTDVHLPRVPEGGGDG